MKILAKWKTVRHVRVHFLLRYSAQCGITDIKGMKGSRVAQVCLSIRGVRVSYGKEGASLRSSSNAQETGFSTIAFLAASFLDPTAWTFLLPASRGTSLYLGRYEFLMRRKSISIRISIRGAVNDALYPSLVVWYTVRLHRMHRDVVPSYFCLFDKADRVHEDTGRVHLPAFQFEDSIRTR